ncbi:SprT-like domain-containing protein [Spirosoma koreense]
MWQHYQFKFLVVKPRRTRLGDFRVLPHHQTQITVNANQNPYAFLITYVHEVAHAEVNTHYRLQRRNRIRPHGTAWQQAFQRLMQPMLTEAVFPIDILQPLRQYLSKPAATTYANPRLMAALRQADPPPVTSQKANQILLSDVPEGGQFQFAKKTFIRGTLRRTRVVCKEISSGKSYAILAHAWVEVNEK